jgi:hypothetical protein
MEEEMEKISCISLEKLESTKNSATISLQFYADYYGISWYTNSSLDKILSELNRLIDLTSIIKCDNINLFSHEYNINEDKNVWREGILLYTDKQRLSLNLSQPLTVKKITDYLDLYESVLQCCRINTTIFDAIINFLPSNAGEHTSILFLSHLNLSKYLTQLILNTSNNQCNDAELQQSLKTFLNDYT